MVGVDGQEGGRDAIALARVLPAPVGELTLPRVQRADPRCYRSVSVESELALRDDAVELLESA